MDTARYVVGVLMVTLLPPGLLWWFVVHPFAAAWRRIGPRATLSILAIAGLASAAGLALVRDRLLGADLGTRWPLIGVAALLWAAAIAIGVTRKRHLTPRILAGVPELDGSGSSGSLLTEGIYARIRHPRYVEVAVGTLGYACFVNHAGAWWMAALTIPVLHLIVLLEERELHARFGEAWEAYRSRVPRYLPGRR